MKLASIKIPADENVSPKVVACLRDISLDVLAMNEGKLCYGILYLRLKNLKPIHVIHVCQRLFEKDLDVVPGTILVIKDSRIRIRGIEEVQI